MPNADFDRVRITNLIVQQVLNHGGTLEDCICALAEHQVVVWTCPIDMIPFTPPSQEAPYDH